MMSVDSNFNFLCGRSYGAGPPPPVHMRPPEPDTLPRRVDVINEWPLTSTTFALIYKPYGHIAQGQLNWSPRELIRGMFSVANDSVVSTFDGVASEARGSKSPAFHRGSSRTPSSTPWVQAAIPDICRPPRCRLRRSPYPQG